MAVCLLTMHHTSVTSCDNGDDVDGVGDDGEYDAVDADSGDAFDDATRMTINLHAMMLTRMTTRKMTMMMTMNRVNVTHSRLFSC